MDCIKLMLLVMTREGEFFYSWWSSFGSLGCIDLGNRELDFFDKLEKYGRDVILNVRYKKEKLR